MKDQKLEVKIEDGVLSISIGIEILKKAAENIPELNQPIVVTDIEGFAKDVRVQLWRESEDGTTPVHTLLDKMFLACLDQGSEYIDYDAMGLD